MTGLPDPKFAAAMQQRHHVEQPLVVALETGRCRCVPERVHEAFRARRIRGGKAGDGVDGNQPFRVAGFEAVAIQRELAAVFGPLLF
jgi:hypothetical protein